MREINQYFNDAGAIEGDIIEFDYRSETLYLVVQSQLVELSAIEVALLLPMEAQVRPWALHCSTMHKIHDKEFVLDDFSHEHLISNQVLPASRLTPLGLLEGIIYELNGCRAMYLDTRDKKWWWQMIQLLPSSYNQKRTIMMNYEVLSGIYPARKDHKLDEWHDFCRWIEELPYSKFILVKE